MMIKGFHFGGLFYFSPMEQIYTTKLSIKAWAEDDRPREKLLQKGRDVLTDAELVAILIGSGNRHESAVDLSKRILGSVGNDLNELGKMGIKQLMDFRGIGEAKAISIAAALELGRRRGASGPEKKRKINGSKDAYEILSPMLSDLSHEVFYAVYLNRANKVIEKCRISQGGVTGTVADTRIIFKLAIEKLASGIILAHNHPSGNLLPSQADIKLTKNLVEAGKMLEIPILDHLIVGDGSYHSFADEGLI